MAESPHCTTKPEVIEALARLMTKAGKDVVIGEGSASCNGFNVQGSETYRTRNRELLDGMQQVVFDRLGYSELAKSLDVMEGDGPGAGPVVKMDVIVAGANPLATDMVAADLMGFKPQRVLTFTKAHKAGMGPTSLDEIEVRGISLNEARRKFAKPNLASWNSIRDVWVFKELK